jgi:hypothetical protein
MFQVAIFKDKGHLAFLGGDTKHARGSTLLGTYPKRTLS